MHGGWQSLLEDPQLHALAQRVAGRLCARYSQILMAYGRRVPEAEFLLWTRDKDNPGESHRERLNKKAVISEVLILVHQCLSGKLPPDMAIALHEKNFEQLEHRLLSRCLSRFSEGARDPRFKAIRTVLHQASQEGKLLYRAGRGIFSPRQPRTSEGESTDQFYWTHFAYGDEEGLKRVPQGLLAQESYTDWPLAPALAGGSGISTETRPQQQKALVLAAASFFWEEVKRRHGPFFLPVAELQRYIQATLPPWYVDAMLPDPARQNISNFPGQPPGDDEPDPWLNPTLASQGEDGLLTHAYDPALYEEPLESLPLQKTAERLALSWMDEIGLQRAVLFCLIFHCHYGATQTARILGLKNPQNADENYKQTIRRMKIFCSLQEGLADPDLDRDLVRLFMSKLHNLCEERVLENGCHE